jgi:hypothetical protein
MMPLSPTIQAALDRLEALIARLQAGVIFPTVLLAKDLEFVRQWLDARQQAPPNSAAAGATGAPLATARAQVDRVFWALESLERGESGAAGAVVIHSRELIRLLRTA